jgi:16S rRNA (uracil1498-N3)-methyltransferase
MTRRRWMADEFAGDSAALVGPHADHLIRVLRAHVGQEFDIATGETVRRGRIKFIAADERRVEFELGEPVAAEDLGKITLWLAIFKFDRMEWAIEKCTELGVSRIVPVLARRTDVHLGRSASKRVERWQRIAMQAAEQSRRPTVPSIEAPRKLGPQLLEGIEAAGIVLAESEQQMDLKSALGTVQGQALTLAIGPEGGWVDDELKLFLQHGWQMASLGRTILRAETAAIAALAVAMSELQIR